MVVVAAAFNDLEDGALVGGVVIAELGCTQVLRDRGSGCPARRGPESLDNVCEWKLFFCCLAVAIEELGPDVDGGRGRAPQRGAQQDLDADGDGAARPVSHAEDVDLGEC